MDWFQIILYKRLLYNSTTSQWKKEPLSSTTRGWNPVTSQWKNYSHYGGQTHNNKCTDKFHKMDEKSTHFEVHVYPSIFGFFSKLSHCTQNPFKNSVWYIYIFIYFPMLTEKQAPLFCHFLSLVPSQKQYLSLCRYLFFCFILVHTQVGEKLVYYYLYHEEASF